MDISIIVPCKNIEKYIKNLLYSFHMVNFDNINYEIIFVMDNESDPTINSISQYGIGLNYKVIYSKTTFVGMARNCGLEHAQGKYIWFVDGDDWIINPEVLQQILPILEKSNEPIAQLKFVSNYFNMQHYSMVWQYVFRKDFLKGLQFSNIQYQEDNDFMQKVFAKYGNDSLPYLDIPSYYYNYRRPGSNTYIQWGMGK